MNCIETAISRTVSIEVNPLRYRVNRTAGGLAYTFAVQRLVVTTQDGSAFEMSLFLENGCTSVAPGEVGSLPDPEELEGAQK